MEIHHLNCGTMEPFGRRLINGEGGFFETASLVTHCLLVDTGKTLLLVDTGMGLDETRHPERVEASVRWTMRPRLDPEETAYRQVQDLGYDPEDVEHVVITHLDVDHAGGLKDFPEATVHLLEPEYRVTQSPGLKQKLRYIDRQWDHDPNWNPRIPEDDWFGFDAVSLVDNHKGQPSLVSLPGHSPGHAGFAVRTDEGWLLHAGDAYFDPREIDSDDPWCPVGLRLMQATLAHNNQLRKRTQEELRSLSDHPEVSMFCSHSVKEFSDFRSV